MKRNLLSYAALSDKTPATNRSIPSVIPPKNKTAILVLAFLCAISLNGCAGKKIDQKDTGEALKKLRKTSAQVQTVRGRAWLSVKAPEGSVSFPAVLVIDRVNMKLRLEAHDLLGATHALFLMGPDGKLTWYDFDRKEEIRYREESWHGIPTLWLVDLMIGALPVTPKTGEVAVDVGLLEPEASYVLRGYSYKAPKKCFAFNSIFKKFLDSKDFGLPAEIQMNGGGCSGDASKADIKLELAWRERTWNQPIDDKLFEWKAPNGWTTSLRGVD